MPFPKVPRVIYTKNPLEKVLCQLRFPPILKISSNAPVEYQDIIRSNYPFYQERAHNQPASEIMDQIPPEIGKLFFGDESKVYDFTSEDKRWTVTLAKEFLALTAHDYKRWEEFSEHLTKPLEALYNLYSPSFYTRIGLRYQNVIRRSNLGLQGTKWSELLRPYIAGALAAPDLEEEFVTDIAQRVDIKLQDARSQVRILHRFVKAQDGEICYLIDSDFYIEQRTEINDAFDRLNYFNRRAGRLFQWCISERLHEAMEPRQV